MIPTLAVELPRPLRCCCFETLAAAYNSWEPCLRQARAVVAGNSTEIPAILNHNARLTELVAKYGACDMFAVAHGLDLEPGEGLSAAIAPGHAFGETLLEVASTLKVELWDNALNYVWLKNDTTPQVNNGSIEPPEGEGVYLGCIRVSEGIQEEVSTHGRFDLRAGNVVRKTMDPGAPGDAGILSGPSWFYTVTQGGIYLWDGQAYWKVGEPA
jgi:hypothetical protein